VYTILAGKYKGKRLLEGLATFGRAVLKGTLKE
jgi:hypothetical protein